MEYGQIVQTVQGVLGVTAGRRVEITVVLLAMSPRLFQHGEGAPLQAAWGGALEQATEGRNEREGDGSACCEQDGAAGGGSGDQGACKGSAVLHVQYAQQCHGADNVMENPVGSL